MDDDRRVRLEVALGVGTPQRRTLARRISNIVFDNDDHQDKRTPLPTPPTKQQLLPYHQAVAAFLAASMCLCLYISPSDASSSTAIQQQSPYEKYKLFSLLLVSFIGLIAYLSMSTKTLFGDSMDSRSSLAHSLGIVGLVVAESVWLLVGLGYLGFSGGDESSYNMHTSSSRLLSPMGYFGMLQVLFFIVFKILQIKVFEEDQSLSSSSSGESEEEIRFTKSPNRPKYPGTTKFIWFLVSLPAAAGWIKLLSAQGIFHWMVSGPASSQGRSLLCYFGVVQLVFFVLYQRLKTIDDASQHQQKEESTQKNRQVATSRFAFVALACCQIFYSVSWESVRSAVLFWGSLVLLVVIPVVGMMRVVALERQGQAVTLPKVFLHWRSILASIVGIIIVISAVLDFSKFLHNQQQQQPTLIERDVPNNDKGQQFHILGTHFPSPNKILPSQGSRPASKEESLQEVQTPHVNDEKDIKQIDKKSKASDTQVVTESPRISPKTSPQYSATKSTQQDVKFPSHKEVIQQEPQPVISKILRSDEPKLPSRTEMEEVPKVQVPASKKRTFTPMVPAQPASVPSKVRKDEKHVVSQPETPSPRPNLLTLTHSQQEQETVPQPSPSPISKMVQKEKLDPVANMERAKSESDEEDAFMEHLESWYRKFLDNIVATPRSALEPNDNNTTSTESWDNTLNELSTWWDSVVEEHRQFMTQSQADGFNSFDGHRRSYKGPMRTKIEARLKLINPESRQLPGFWDHSKLENRPMRRAIYQWYNSLPPYGETVVVDDEALLEDGFNDWYEQHKEGLSIRLESPQWLQEKMNPWIEKHRSASWLIRRERRNPKGEKDTKKRRGIRSRVGGFLARLTPPKGMDGSRTQSTTSRKIPPEEDQKRRRDRRPFQKLASFILNLFASAKSFLFDAQEDGILI